MYSSVVPLFADVYVYLYYENQYSLFCFAEAKLTGALAAVFSVFRPTL
jgi:hypothetical protein